MRVKDIIGRTVHSTQAADRIVDAAQAMDRHNVGFLPVLDGTRLVGVLTDRDIALRAVAAGIDLGTPVDSIMTRRVTTCSEAEPVEQVVETMARVQVRRLPVCNASHEVVSIVSLADAARHLPDRGEAAAAFTVVRERDGMRCQAATPGAA